MPCCGCCGNGFVFGHLMYIFEKLAAFCAMAAVVSCIIVTMLVSIGVGVGVGYNYCFAMQKTEKLAQLDNPERNSGKLPRQPHVHPFSGESSVEETSVNTNTLIVHTPGPPIFPSIPNVSSDGGYDPIKGQLTPPEQIVPTGLSGVDGSESDSFPGPPGGIVFSSGESTGIPVARPDIPDDLFNPYNGVTIPPGHQMTTFTETESVTSNGDYGGSKPDGDLSIIPVMPEHAPMPLGREESLINVPQSPIFTGSFRRVPTSFSKGVASKPGSNPSHNRFFEFEDIREGVKDNVMKIENKVATKNITKGPSHGRKGTREKYKGRKPQKKISNVTKSTTYMPTIIVPLKKHANMTPLIKQILSQNKNVTLQFITL